MLGIRLFTMEGSFSSQVLRVEGRFPIRYDTLIAQIVAVFKPRQSSRLCLSDGMVWQACTPYS
jgi:hypothetical protein